MSQTRAWASFPTVKVDIVYYSANYSLCVISRFLLFFRGDPPCPPHMDRQTTVRIVTGTAAAFLFFHQNTERK